MNRRFVAWVLLGIIGIYCLFISLLGRVAFAYGYRPEAHSTILLVRYLQPVLVLPFFLVSLVPRRWATLPLWMVCVSIAIFPYLIRDQGLRALMGYWNAPLGVRMIKELVIIMVIPVVAQIAVWLRTGSNKQVKGDQVSAQTN